MINSKILFLLTLSYTVISATPVAYPFAFAFPDPEEKKDQATKKDDHVTSTTQKESVSVDEDKIEDSQDPTSLPDDEDVRIVEIENAYKNLTGIIEPLLHMEKNKVNLIDKGSSTDKNSSNNQQKTLNNLKKLDNQLAQSNERVKDAINEKNEKIKKAKKEFIETNESEYDVLNEIHHKLKKVLVNNG